MAASAPVPSSRDPFRRADDVLWREGDFGVTVLGSRSAEPQTLTGTGRALWHALAHPVSPDALAAELAAQFGVDQARISADIGPVLAALQRIGAIVVEPR